MVQSCIACNAFISPRSPALKCVKCKKWCHAAPCTNLSESQLDFYLDEAKREGGRRWTCVGCSGASTSGDGVPLLTSFTGSTASLESTIASVLQQQFELKFDVFRRDMMTLFNGEMKKLHDKINDVSRENAALRMEVNELKSRSTQSAQDVVEEIREREIRSKNVVVFGVPESSEKQADMQSIDDSTHIQAILQTADISAAPKKVFRLGKRIVGKVRPIKVVFSDSSVVKDLLRNKKCNGNIQVKSDLTPAQQSHLKQLNAELKRRVDNGESDLTIKFIRSIPKIIKRENN